MAKHKWIKVTSITLGVIIFIIIGIPYIASKVVSSNALRSTIISIAGRYIPKGEVQYDTLSLSLFEEFPYLSFKLSNGQIISGAYSDETDSVVLLSIPDEAFTPVKFKQLLISVNIPKLILGKIDVRRIRLDNPEIYAYISPWEKPNWDIFSSDTDVQEEADTSSTSIDLNVKRISIREAVIIYDSRPDEMSMEADINRLNIRGNLATDLEKIKIDNFRIKKSEIIYNDEKNQSLADIRIDSLRIRKKQGDTYSLSFSSSSDVMLESKVYCSNLPILLFGQVSVNPSQQSCVIDTTTFSIAGIPIVMSGGIRKFEKYLETDFGISIDTMSVDKTLSYIDHDILPQKDMVTTNLTASLSAKIEGQYYFDGSKMPSVSANIEIPTSQLLYPKEGVKVDTLTLDAHLDYLPDRPLSTGVKIHQMDLVANGVSLHVKGSVMNLLDDPNVDVTALGNLNLDKISNYLLTKHGITAHGNADVDLKGVFNMSDLSMANIGRTRIRGRIEADSLYVDMPKDTIKLIAMKGRVSFGSSENKRDTLMEKGINTLRASLRADSLYADYKHQFYLSLSKGRVSARGAAEIASGDTTKVQPVTGKVEAQRFRLTTADSSRINVRDLKGNLSILPSKIADTIPVINFAANARRLSYRDRTSRYSLRNCAFDITGTNAGNSAEDIRQQKRRERRLDSLQIIYPHIQRDSLTAYNRRMRNLSLTEDDFGTKGNVEVSVSNSIKKIFADYDIRGSLKAKGGRVVTPIFPLRNNIDSINISFNTNEVNFYETAISSGESDIRVNGRIWGIKNVIRGRGKLRADIGIESDTLNLNELVTAANAGAAYSASTDKDKNALVALDDDDKMQQALTEMVDTSSSASNLLIIPNNVDMDIRLDVFSGKYAKINLYNVHTELVAKNRSLQIKSLEALTDAGDLMLEALYSTKTKKDLTTGFDLELSDVQVDKLIDLIPSVDTLLPMLRSFSGFINCQIAATSDIDTNMNIVLPSLNGACRITGTDLVLLDGETFTEISKMLKFKDRTNNKIKSISVELLVNNSKIEVFPFIMQMDRYQAAISGIHNLDMTFAYHVSVIKSPLPLRLGINITGDMNDTDHIKYRLG